MIVCPRCGTENASEKRACWKCWSPLPEESAPVPVKAEKAVKGGLFGRKSAPAPEPIAIAPILPELEPEPELAAPTPEPEAAAPAPPPPSRPADFDSLLDDMIAPPPTPPAPVAPPPPPVDALSALLDSVVPAAHAPVEESAPEPAAIAPEEPPAPEPDILPVEEPSAPEATAAPTEELAVPAVEPAVETPAEAPIFTEAAAEEPAAEEVVETAHPAEEMVVFTLLEEGDATEAPEGDAPDTEGTPVVAPVDLPPTEPVAAVPVAEDAPLSEEPVPPPTRRGAVWLIIAAVLLALVLIGALLLWYVNMRPRTASAGPSAVAGAYFAAVSQGDTVTPQQLATRDSKSLFTPGWFIIQQATPHAVTLRKDTAVTDVDVLLTPHLPDAMQSPALVGALSQRYHVTAMLRCEKDGWHIDQRAFFDALHHAITAAHPTVSLPDWP